jgi:hypothetical protein
MQNCINIYLPCFIRRLYNEFSRYIFWKNHKTFKASWTETNVFEYLINFENSKSMKLDVFWFEYHMLPSSIYILLWRKPSGRVNDQSLCCPLTWVQDIRQRICANISQIISFIRCKFFTRLPFLPIFASFYFLHLVHWTQVFPSWLKFIVSGDSRTDVRFAC